MHWNWHWKQIHWHTGTSHIPVPHPTCPPPPPIQHPTRKPIYSIDVFVKYHIQIAILNLRNERWWIFVRCFDPEFSVQMSTKLLKSTVNGGRYIGTRLLVIQCTQIGKHRVLSLVISSTVTSMQFVFDLIHTQIHTHTYTQVNRANQDKRKYI